MKRRAGAAIVGVAATCVYWRTAFPTITWWDSSSYSLAAATFGVSSSPGSLLLMLLGAPIAHLPVSGSPAYRLNLLAGVFAAVAAAGVYVAALQALRIALHIPLPDAPRIAFSDARPTTTQDSVVQQLGAGAGALVFAFGSTTWEYAVMFTPYILTVVFTVALLFTLLRWWEQADDSDAWKWLALLALLFGFDFSVHRTNALLIPGALVFLLIRSPRSIFKPRAVAASLGGFAAGLSVQLLIIPIARFTTSALNFGNPRDLGRFREYFTLSQSGGSFFVKIYPRNADWWSVQVHDFLSALGRNALHWRGERGWTGILPALAAVFGLAAIWKRNRKLAVALGSLLLLQALMTVVFFNIPANYFRSLDRHYLPVWATIGVLIACGLGVSAEWAWRNRLRRAPLAWAIVAVLATMPLAQLLDNWHAHNASNRYFARDYAINALTALPQNAIYFTVGDNDTFPLMYMQQVEHVRPDVLIANMSVLAYQDYPYQQQTIDPLYPVSLPADERERIVKAPWTDTIVTLPFPDDGTRRGLAGDTAHATFIVKPTWGATMTRGELTFLDIVRTNAWRRPITFSITASTSGMSWLEPYGRLEGLYWRIVPTRHPGANLGALQRNLLSQYAYRGYADASIELDDVDKRFGMLYHQSLAALADGLREKGDTAACERAVNVLTSAVPRSRLVGETEAALSALPRCE